MSNEVSKYEQAKNFIFGLNRIEGFPVEALTGSIVTDEEEEIVILPLNAKAAWFRAVYPEGHCEDEPFGECSENVANVKVTVYAGGDTSRQLGHATAVRVFDPQTDGNWAPLERRTRLYNIASGMAKSKALTDAGIGMGYYASRAEFNEMNFESVKRSNVPPMPIQPIESEGAPKKPSRASAAATAESKLNEFVSVIEQIIEVNDGMKAKLDDGTRKHFEGTLKTYLDRYEKLLSDLEQRAEKGAANPENGISRVLTAEIIAQEVAKMPKELISKESEEAMTVSSPAPSSSESILETNTSELIQDEQLSLDVIPETTTSESPEETKPIINEADEDLGEYIIPCLNVALKDLDKKRVLWIILSTKPDFTAKDKTASDKYYRKVATPEELEAYERRIAG